MVRGSVSNTYPKAIANDLPGSSILRIVVGTDDDGDKYGDDVGDKYGYRGAYTCNLNVYTFLYDVPKIWAIISSDTLSTLGLGLPS